MTRWDKTRNIIHMKFKQEKTVNNGKGPQPKVARNQDLAKDYLDKKTMAEMVAKYKISPKNIYEILDKLGVPRNRRQEAKPVKLTDLKKSK